MSPKFTYQHIEQELKRRIESGYYKPNVKLGSSKGLAVEFDSSPVTVDRALQKLVESGYLTRTQRRGTFVNPISRWNNHRDRNDRTHLVGAIVFDSSSPYIWAPAIRGMERGLQRNNFHLVICNDEGDPEKARRYIDDLSDKGIDGFIVVPLGMPTREEYEKRNRELVEHLWSRNLPFVLYHRHMDQIDCPAVVSNNYEATRALLAKFMESGVRRPICLSHYHSSVAADRERGFRDELESRGVPDVDERVFKLMPHRLEIDSGNWGEIQEIMRSNLEFDGVFAVGAYVLQAARTAQNGLQGTVKRGIRYASFDYLETTYGSSDVIMSMFQPNYEMGVLAADLLLKKMNEFPDLNARICVASRFVSYGRDNGAE